MTVHWPDTRIRPGYWLGTYGAMLALPDIKGDLSSAGVQREWSVTIPSASPAEVATLVDLAADGVEFRTNLGGLRRAVPPAHGPHGGPFIWLTPWSTRTNILPPLSVSGPTGWAVTGAGAALSQGGPVVLEDGVAATSTQATFGTIWFSPLLPVVPGQQVTASAYVRKGDSNTNFRIDWMNLGDEQDATTSTQVDSVPVTATAAPLPRQVVTATVPENVHVARIRIVGASQVASPAFTWTSEVQERSAGHGCLSAYVHGLTMTPRIAREGTLRHDVSFTVTEAR